MLRQGLGADERRPSGKQCLQDVVNGKYSGRAAGSFRSVEQPTCSPPVPL